jgi:hypothetical protein
VSAAHRGRRRAPPAAALVALAALAGCSVETTYEHVYPILQSRCNSCHVDGVSTYRPYFTDYDTVSLLARTLRDTVTSREMPPFGMDDTTLCGGNYFADEGLWLSDVELQTLSDWVDDGVPAGDLDHLRSAPAYVEPELAHVDATVDTGAPYAFSGFDPDSQHRCFVADLAMGDATLLTGFQVAPGNRFAVQSAAIYALDGEEAQAAATALDAADDAPGYPCFGGAGVDGARFVGSWVWGRSVVRFPAGTGVQLAPATQVVIQVHYNPQGGSLYPDENTTRVDLELTGADSATEARYVPLAASGFSLRPGLGDAEARGFLVVDQPLTILGVAPLMYQRGVSMVVSRVRPFSETCLARVNHWAFYNHLRLYQYLTTPPQVFAGDELDIQCTFDTQSQIEPTREGQDPASERCMARLYVVPTP